MLATIQAENKNPHYAHYIYIYDTCLKEKTKNGEKNILSVHFKANKLKRLTPYKDDKEELAQQLKKQQDQHREQKQEQT